MIAEKKLFENIFDEIAITSPRLYAFASDAIAKLTAANTSNQYTTIISLVLPKAEDLHLEIGDVKASVNVQLGKTITVNQVIDGFKAYMSDNEGVIARPLGGKETPAFLAFYPHGITEYHKANKTTLPALLFQVTKAVELYSSQIGATIAAELLAFDTQYTEARKAQQQQKGIVSDSRVERSANRTALELSLLIAIHTIASMYPGDVEKCTSFFNFNLLLPVSKAAKKVTPKV